MFFDQTAPLFSVLLCLHTRKAIDCSARRTKFNGAQKGVHAHMVVISTFTGMFYSSRLKRHWAGAAGCKNMCPDVVILLAGELV